MTISDCERFQPHPVPADHTAQRGAGRARHDAGEQYAAVIDREGQPRHVVSLHLELDFVEVERVGPHGQPVDVLIFRREYDGRLF